MNKHFSLFLIISLFLGGALGAFKKRLESSLNAAPSHLHGTSVSAILLGANNVRVYEVTNGIVVEHANDGNGWYVGTFPQPIGQSVAATNIGNGVRVYVSDCGTVTEYGYNFADGDFSNPTWFSGGGFSTSGKILSAFAFTSGGSWETIYVYVEQDGNIVQYYDDGAWSSPSILSF